jgi:hypothetical protein
MIIYEVRTLELQNFGKMMSAICHLVKLFRVRIRTVLVEKIAQEQNGLNRNDDDEKEAGQAGRRLGTSGRILE